MTSATGFASGTFAPADGEVPVARTVLRLSWLEFKLFSRNAEQLVVNLIIPVTGVVAFTLLPFGDLGPDRAASVVPAVMAAAIISSAFTGQAIAIAFDRRYGALKRIGATVAPRWAIIVGKSFAVSGVIAAQLVVIGIVGLLIGWRPLETEVFNMALVAAAGALCFSGMGLLLGGGLRAELVLPLANILWLAQLGTAVMAIVAPASDLIEYSPAGALAIGMTSTSVSAQAYASLILLAWALVASGLARRYFRFV